MSRTAPEPRQFHLAVALIISGALHLLLVLITLWAPLTRPVVQAREPEETLLHFTFAPDVQTQAEEPQQAQGVPVPIEPTPATQRPPAPPDYEPEGPASLETPSSAGLPPEPEPLPQPEEPAQRAPEPERENPSQEADREAATDLPEREEDAVARHRPEPGEPAASEQERQLDLNRALRDFGDAVTRAREARPSEPGSGRARNTFQPDPASVPPTGFGAGNLTFESRDYDWSDYARQIYIALWRAWHNRLYQTTEDFEKWAHQNQNWYLRHWTQVRFVIERNGDVSGIQIETPSGCEPLDQSAFDALVEVILPQLPADFPRDREVVHVRFIANGPINQMRPVLTQLKQMGLF